jgi:hypothetical protein
MKAMIYPTIFLFLFGMLGCSRDEYIELQDSECIELTIDDSLYDHLTTETQPINVFAMFYIDHGPMAELVDECLHVRLDIMGSDRSSLVYQLVWNGEIEHDTANVHFYLYDSNILPGQEMVAIGHRKKIAFNIGEIIQASHGEKLFLQTHFYDAYYNDRYLTVIRVQ